MKIGVVGLGYVGLPLGVAFAEAGHDVVGVDTDPRNASTRSARGESYIEDVAATSASARIARRASEPRPATRTSRRSRPRSIAVPTPLTRNREPDLGPLVAAGTLAGAACCSTGQLVVLESTTYPGTTRERLVPLLEESGLAAGRDFNVAFSPSGSTRAAPTTRCATRRRSSAG